MTGSTHAGTKNSGFVLGSNQVILGTPNSSISGYGPLSSGTATAKTNTRPFYGLSGVFTVKTPPALSIADASAAENAGHFLFDVTLSRALRNTVKVDFETISGGTATEGLDYHARRTYTHVILAGDRLRNSADGASQSSILLVTHSPWIADWMPAPEDRRHAERWK